MHLGACSSNAQQELHEAVPGDRESFAQRQGICCSLVLFFSFFFSPFLPFSLSPFFLFSFSPKMQSHTPDFYVSPRQAGRFASSRKK